MALPTFHARSWRLPHSLVAWNSVLFVGIFLDLRKAYDAMDQDRCLKIPHGVGVGEKTVWLIARFWKESGLCCRAAGFYGRLFKARRGVTQGGPLSPTIFNLMVDAVVREWERQLVAGGLGLDNVRQLFACFYADNGLLAARDPEPYRLRLAF